MYHPFSYFVSKMVVGFTLLALLVCVGSSTLPPPILISVHRACGPTRCAECSIVYWMVGLRSDKFYYFLFFVFTVLLPSWAGEVPLPPPPPTKPVLVDLN